MIMFHQVTTSSSYSSLFIALPPVWRTGRWLRCSWSNPLWLSVSVRTGCSCASNS